MFKGNPDGNKEYMGKLIKGDPDKVEKGRKALYEGRNLSSETPLPEKGVEKTEEHKAGDGQKIDIDAYTKAYAEYLKDPSKFSEKPKPSDFPLKEIEEKSAEEE